MLALLLLGPLALFFAYRTYRLAQNYLAARAFGLPIIVLPVSFEDAWWMPLRPLFKWVEKLPFGLGYWYIYTEMGWPTIDGMRTVNRLGENFVLVSPYGNQIITCYEPGVAKSFKDNRNWIAPESQGQLFAFFGQNVSSTNGVDWQRHRKIVSGAFNEATMKKVWIESIRRAKELDFSNPIRTLAGIRSTFDIMAMHILGAAGFDHNSGLTQVPPGHRESLMGCLGFILQNIILTVIFNGLAAPDFLLPKTLRQLKVSVAEFRMYMEEAVLRQMQQSKVASEPRASLLAAMVNANESEKQQLQEKTGRPSYLTESELYGNIFVFNLAGYETTASSFAFALAYLAAYPEMQDWVAEEIDKVYAHDTNKAYEELYHRLPRCLAVMHETLRLASPAPLLIRSPLSPTELPVITKLGPSSITVPPNTSVGCHFFGAHLSSRWGTDVYEFNPQRFIATENGGESVEIPQNTLYIPWSFGARNCPGKKFSQVEFVAVLAQLLSGYRVEMLINEGESYQAARNRTLDCLSDKYFHISAHFNRPEDAGVRLCRR
jgi:cytochrome P450